MKLVSFTLQWTHGCTPPTSPFSSIFASAFIYFFFLLDSFFLFCIFVQWGNFNPKEKIFGRVFMLRSFEPNNSLAKFVKSRETILKNDGEYMLRICQVVFPRSFISLRKFLTLDSYCKRKISSCDFGFEYVELVQIRCARPIRETMTSIDGQTKPLLPLKI